jgi:tetratricopeptide (TPR) repeat protein
LALALTRLGYLERRSGIRDAARLHYGEAAAIYRREGDRLALAHTVRHLGDIHQEAGDIGLAEPCLQEALNIYRGDDGSPPLDLANAIRSMAVLKVATGDDRQAEQLWREARDLYSALKVEAGVAECDQRPAR